MADTEDNKDQQVESLEETTNELPVVERPIFDSLIDNKENSRYIHDMTK